MAVAVRSQIYFLERSERWAKEKPYNLDYIPQPPALKSNATALPEDITIEDIRGREDEFSFADHGFRILPLDCSLKPKDYDDDDKVKAIYMPQLAEAVKTALGASRVQIYDYIVRKRDAQFPMSNGGYYGNKQPSSIAHIDLTPDCMDKMLPLLNPEHNTTGGRYQSVNVWKPLRGPLHDWPLTLCDPRTIRACDLQARDTVKTDSVIETYQVHYLPGQKWYYIDGQRPDEAWMFLQADSQGRLGVPHTSFANPQVGPTDIPRESIEVRTMVYYADEKE